MNNGELITSLEELVEEVETEQKAREHAEYMSQEVFPGIRRRDYDSWRNEGN